MTVNELDAMPEPTFGQMLRYLRGLGFSASPRLDGVVDCREPNTETVLLFRGRPDHSLMRKNEVFLARVQLAARGVVSEREFDRALNAELQPTS